MNQTWRKSGDRSQGGALSHTQTHTPGCKVRGGGGWSFDNGLVRWEGGSWGSQAWMHSDFTPGRIPEIRNCGCVLGVEDGREGGEEGFYGNMR